MESRAPNLARASASLSPRAPTLARVSASSTSRAPALARVSASSTSRAKVPQASEPQREHPCQMPLASSLPRSMRRQGPGVAHFADSAVETRREVPQMYETVGDVMTTTVISVTADTSVLEALDLIVKHRITGMPVVDSDNRVVGVVSDYDLLAMDLSSLNIHGMFPSLDQSWQTFKEVRKLVSKVEGKTVADVMTEDPLVVRPNTSLDMAARILLESKIRRLPVLDQDGKLIGLLSRRNIVVAALYERMHNDSGLFNGFAGDIEKA